MKKLVYILPFLLVGCTAEMNDIYEFNVRPISYTIEGISNPVTKASLINNVTDIVGTSKEFFVYGIQDNEVVINDSFSIDDYKTTGTYYWNGKDYTFYAFPNDGFNGSFQFKGDSMVIDASVGTNSASTPDHLIARTVANSGNVSFTMHHFFTAVCVKYAKMNAAHTITGVRIVNTNLSGTCTMTDVPTWSNLSNVGTISDTRSQRVYYNGQTLTEDGYIFMTIPGQDIDIEVDINGKTITSHVDNPSNVGGTLVTFTIEDTDSGSSISEDTGTTKTLTKNGDGTYSITIEAYVKGEVTTTTTTMPTNTVLVLDTSKSMDEKLSSSKNSKLTILKSVCNDFINTMASTGKEHYISIVSFNGSATTLCSKVDTRTGKSTLLTAISNLKTSTGTASNKGLENAKALMQDSTKFYNAIVFVTDGEPGTSKGKFDTTVANSAVSTSNDCKNTYNAHVYSIGIFDEGSASTNCKNFMERVSSNYKDATTYTNGTVVSDKYYTIGSSESAISNIMSNIQKDVQSGGAAVQLSTEAYVLDVVSDAFEVPKGGDIVLKQARYNETTETFGAEEDITDMTVTFTLVGHSLTVTGFDYSKYFCGKGNKNGGRKLVIHINNLKLDPDAPAGSYSNEYGSGLYDGDGNMVTEFQSPKI